MVERRWQQAHSVADADAAWCSAPPRTGRPREQTRWSTPPRSGARPPRRDGSRARQRGRSARAPASRRRPRRRNRRRAPGGRSRRRGRIRSSRESPFAYESTRFRIDRVLSLSEGPLFTHSRRPDVGFKQPSDPLERPCSEGARMKVPVPPRGIVCPPKPGSSVGRDM